LFNLPVQRASGRPGTCLWFSAATVATIKISGCAQPCHELGLHGKASCPAGSGREGSAQLSLVGACLEAAHGAVGPAGSSEAALAAAGGCEGLVGGDGVVIELIVEGQVDEELLGRRRLHLDGGDGRASRGRAQLEGRHHRHNREEESEHEGARSTHCKKKMKAGRVLGL